MSGSNSVLLTNGPLPPGRTYVLEQFHAHWGGCSARGSEHLVDGTAYAAELHLVFWNSIHSSFKEALSQPKGLAVLAVFLEEGETGKNELHEVEQSYQIIISFAIRAWQMNGNFKYQK